MIDALAMVMTIKPRTDRQLSELADRLVAHVIYGRTMKALRIAQFLRQYYGLYLVKMNISTGQS